MDLFEQAFEQAKYRAGTSQYKLANQYLEMCAKNNRKGKFKKGLGWANFLGVLLEEVQRQLAIKVLPTNQLAASTDATKVIDN